MACRLDILLDCFKETEVIMRALASLDWLFRKRRMRMQDALVCKPSLKNDPEDLRTQHSAAAR